METDDANASPSWRVVAIGACSLVLASGGYLVGDTLTGLRAELKDVRQIMDSRSSLAPRLETVERQTGDQERRLREVEIRLGAKH